MRREPSFRALKALCLRFGIQNNRKTRIVKVSRWGDPWRCSCGFGSTNSLVIEHFDMVFEHDERIYVFSTRTEEFGHALTRPRDDPVRA